MNKSTPSVETILAEAVELATPAERQAFVAAACGGDEALQHRVEQLIAFHFQAGNFLEQPVVAFDPEGTAGWQAAESANGVGTIIGPNKLLEQIGEGGMGLVYVAEQHQPIKRRVALKVIKPGMDSRQVIARFEAERQALALMDHPHIAKVHDGGTTPEGRPYFVMELVKGTPITDYCDQHRLNTRQRLELFLDVCHAVQHAHQKGIIHRDLKPSNILVSLHDVTPVVKVIDFGIAKATSGRLTDKTVYTAFAQMVGTPMYMSPEQAGLSDIDVDTRSDVYSLGVLLYELLIGMTPFDPETLKKASYDEMRRIIREDEPARPSTRLSTMQQAALSTIAEKRGLEPWRLSQQVRGELDWIAMRALEKDRNRRYESASAFAADVQRYLEGEPVQACPPSAGYRFRKFARRNKVALVTAGLVAAALVIGTAVSVWQAVEAKAAHKLAEERLESEKQARHDAEAHFQKAMNAVKRMLVEVGDEKVGAIPQMKQTRQRLLDEALAFYTDLIASNPNNSQVYYERGELYKRMGNPEQACHDLKMAVECDPDNAEALGSLGDTLICFAGDATAITYIRRAIELQPTNPLFYFCLAVYYKQIGRTDDAAAAYRKVAEVSRPGDPWAYVYLGDAAMLLGDRRTARENYTKCLSIDPTNATAHRAIGGMHSARGEYDRALASFTKALESPQVSSHALLDIYVARAEMHTRQKKHAAALSDLNKAIELRPWMWHIYKRRGYAHFQLNHFEQALADIAKAVELQPADVSNLLWIPFEDVASCPDEKFRTGMVALADKTIQILESKPNASEDVKIQAHCARASLYLATRKFDQANRLVSDLLERQRRKEGPKSAETASCMAMLGNLLLRQQQYVTAEPILRECLAIREQKLPDDWLRYNALSMLGDALLGQKKFVEAEPLLLQGYEGIKQREANILEPYRVIRLAQAAERLVRLYEATKESEKARPWREKLPSGKRPGN